jgi:hypothetical protein
VLESLLISDEEIRRLIYNSFVNPKHISNFFYDSSFANLRDLLILKVLFQGNFRRPDSCHSFFKLVEIFLAVVPKQISSSHYLNSTRKKRNFNVSQNCLIMNRCQLNFSATCSREKCIRLTFPPISVLINALYSRIMTCSQLKVNRRFGGTCRLHVQSLRISQARSQDGVGSKQN